MFNSAEIIGASEQSLLIIYKKKKTEEKLLISINFQSLIIGFTGIVSSSVYVGLSVVLDASFLYNSF